MDERAILAQAFLDACWPDATLSLLAADASARRYFRATHPNGQTRVVMDAPPETGEDIRPFVSMSKVLAEVSLSAPTLYATDEARGFLLLEDLGDALFTSAISVEPQREIEMYLRACDALIALKNASKAGLVEYDADMMSSFIAPLFDDYQSRNGDTVPQASREQITTLIKAAITTYCPTNDVIILRDYHAENLIWIPDRTGAQSVGLLDYQDALIGHRAYDLASLLDDARRDVPIAVRGACTAYFAKKIGVEHDVLLRELAIQGAQRNMRILGIFVSLAHSRGKPKYLDLLPRVWGHLMNNLDHPDLVDLRHAVLASVSPPHIKALTP